MKLFTKEVDKQLFAQYPKGSDLENQMVVAKIFNPYGRGVWYLLNSDPNDPDYIWAIVDLFEPEMGSVSRSELQTVKVPPFGLGLERDIYFTPKPAKEVFEGVLRGERYAAGGMTSGRYYIDNSGNELRYVGESRGKLLFKDGEKIVEKTEEDFEDRPKETKLFGFFEKGGQVEIGSEGMYKGGAAKVLKYDDKSKMYAIKYLNEDGEVEGNFVFARKDDFEYAFANFNPKMAHGGKTNSKRYTVNVYYGGEMEDEEVYTDSLEEAKRLSQSGEHSEIYDNEKKEFVEIEYAHGGEMSTEAQRLADNPNWTNEKLQAQYDSNTKDLRNFNNGLLKPSKVIGGGYKSSAVAKRLAKEWLEKNIATYKKALEIRGVMSKGGEVLYLESVGTYFRPSDMTTSPMEDFKNEGEINWVYENSDEWWEALSKKDKETIGKYNREDFAKKMRESGYKMAKGGEVDTYEVELSAVPNPDYADDRGSVKIKKSRKKVSDVEEARRVVREFIEENDLGGGNWPNGGVYKNGKKIGYISYNGRFWEGDSMAMGGKLEKAIPTIMDKYGNIKSEKKLEQDLKYLKEAYEDKLVTKAEYDKSYNEIKEQIKLLQSKEKGGDTNNAYSEMKDEELLNLHKKLLKDIKPIPLSLVKELNKRGLIKNYIGTYNSNMAMGGKVKFEDKVKAIKASLLKRKKVSPKVQKDYGKTYSPKEAEESAKRIAGALRAKYDLKKKFKKGGKTIAQTPAPKKDRVFGSSTNKPGSASSKKAASKIELNESILKTLSEKAKTYNEKHSSKVSTSTLKAVMRRGMGAYSTSHRPTISGGAPNSRQAWGFARVNKFLLKKGGTKVKAAYVQDDDLL